MKLRTSQPKRVRQGAKTEAFVGILLILLGIAAIARPAYATIASTVVFGCIFLLAGINYLIYTLRTRRLGLFLWKLLLSGVLLGTGLLLLSNILKGALALTLILGVSLLILGVVQVVLAFIIRPATRWTQVLISGIVGMIMGILIWSAWPLRADWIIGFWVGIYFFAQGISMIGLPSSKR